MESIAVKTELGQSPSFRLSLEFCHALLACIIIPPPTYDVINNSRTFECRPHLPYFYSLILRSRPLRMAQHNYDPILDDDIIGR